MERKIEGKDIPMAIAFTFPGQGSQALGMGKDLADAFPEAAAVFAEVDDALGDKLSDICLLYTSPSPRDRQKSRMPSSA